MSEVTVDFVERLVAKFPVSSRSSRGIAARQFAGRRLEAQTAKRRRTPPKFWTRA
jgi:hypothetical protein